MAIAKHLVCLQARKDESWPACALAEYRSERKLPSGQRTESVANEVFEPACFAFDLARYRRVDKPDIAHEGAAIGKISTTGSKQTGEAASKKEDHYRNIHLA